MSAPQKNVRRAAPAGSAPADSPDPPVVQARTRGTRSKSDPGSPRFPRVARAVSVLKVIVGAAIVVGASGGVAWGARRYVTTSPRFAIKSVSVEGSERLGSEQIARLGGVVVGENVFVLDLDSAAKKIEEDPWVKSAKVTRKLPGSVMIAVTEHEPSALVAIGDQLFLASRGGEVFKEAEAEDLLDLPIITGIEPAAVGRDREGVQASVVRALDVVDDVQKTPIAARWPVQEVHLDQDGSLTLVVGADGVSIALGHPPYRGKLEQAERVFAELKKKNADPAIVFLDNENSPERVVVRMR